MRVPTALVGLILAACVAGDSVPGVGIDAAQRFPIFPSDTYTVRDPATRTGLRVSLPADAQRDPLFAVFSDLTAELESLDGFGTSAPLWVRFDGPVDPAGFPSLEESAGDAASIQLIHLASGKRERFETLYDGPTHTLFVLPYGALQPATRYALILTKKLRDRLGAPLRPMNGLAAPDVPIPPNDLIAAAIFTTQSIAETLGALALREVEHTADEFPERVSACAGVSVVGWTGKGRLRSPDYRTEENRFPTALDDKVPVGEPRDVRVPYIMVLPQGALNAPTVVVQHGLSGTKEGVLFCSLGEEYAKHGFATIAVDGAWHGERGPGGEEPSPFSYFRVLLGVWTNGQELTAKLRYGRDAFRQTALDHVQLAALVKTMAADLDTNGDGKPDLSGDVFYNGESMGGIIGSLTTAVAPNLPVSVLNVPGGRLSNLIFLSEIHLYDLVARPIAAAAAGLSSADVRRFVSLFQVIAERADPINYARHWWLNPLEGRVPKSVIVQETIDDVLVPNRTTEDLARAGGLPHLLPGLRKVVDLESVEVPSGGLAGNLGVGLSGGMAQMKLITHDGETKEASHGSMSSDEAVRQAATFFAGWVTGDPVIRRMY